MAPAACSHEHPFGNALGPALSSWVGRFAHHRINATRHRAKR